MKKSILGVILMTALASQVTMPVDTGHLTDPYSLFETGLAAVGKKRTGPFFADMKIVLAMIWESLPEGFQKVRDEQSYIKVFGVAPGVVTRAELKTALSSVGELANAAAASESEVKRLSGQVSDFEKAARESQERESELNGTIESLRDAQRDAQKDWEKAESQFKAADTRYKELGNMLSVFTQAGANLTDASEAMRSGKEENATEEQVKGLAQKVATAYSRYYRAMQLVSERAKELGTEFPQDNPDVDLVVNGQLLGYDFDLESLKKDLDGVSFEELEGQIKGLKAVKPVAEKPAEKPAAQPPAPEKKTGWFR